MLKVMGALPLGHVFVEASTTRGHDEFAALGATLTLPQLRARKVVFIPLLIPQPDWDKYGIIPYLILRVAGLDFASGPIPVNIPHWAVLRPQPAPHVWGTVGAGRRG